MKLLENQTANTDGTQLAVTFPNPSGGKRAVIVSEGVFDGALVGMKSELGLVLGS